MIITFLVVAAEKALRRYLKDNGSDTDERDTSPICFDQNVVSNGPVILQGGASRLGLEELKSYTWITVCYCDCDFSGWWRSTIFWICWNVPCVIQKKHRKYFRYHNMFSGFRNALDIVHGAFHAYQMSPNVTDCSNPANTRGDNNSFSSMSSPCRFFGMIPWRNRWAGVNKLAKVRASYITISCQHCDVDAALNDLRLYWSR
jgi:hypothetical protein